MGNIDIRPYTQSKDLLHQALIDAGSVFKNNKYTCPSPAHDDKNPSASIKELDGHWKWKCHACGAGGDYFDIRAIIEGTTPERVIADLKNSNAPPPKTAAKAPQEPKKTYATLAEVVRIGEYVNKGKCTQQYEYANPDTRQPDLVVLRIETADGKQFFPCHLTPGGWQTGYADGLRPIYNRSRVLRSQSVMVVEGEKCVHALQEIGIVATTSPGGARAAARADWSMLAGKTVYIWRDNDRTKENGENDGLFFQKTVVEQLMALDPLPDIRVIDIAATGLGPKEDAFDFIAKERKQRVPDDLIRQEIEDLMADGKPEGGSQGLYNRLRDIIDGRIDIVDWHWQILSNVTLALQPGTVTILCGDPGSAKSFFLLQAAIWWQLAGHRISIMELEDDREEHLKRALVQLDENSLIFDYHWLRKHGDTALEAYFRHKPVLDALAASIHDDPDTNHTLESMAGWVQEQCARKARVIAIDPITLVEPGREPWIAERKFMVDVKRAIRASGSSLILVTHPKKNRMNTINLDQIAGSSNYPRFCHTVLWLEHLANDEEVDVITYEEVFGARKEVRLYGVKVNKKLHLCKTRLGCGHGYKLAYKMPGKSMCMTEVGLITKSAERKN